jgi:hypothetical protein
MALKPKVLARKRVVFFVTISLVSDHNLCVLAVFCGENSSTNSMTSGFLDKG